MRYINLICFGLALLTPSHILARPRHSVYGFVGGSKMIGHQTNNLSTIEKVRLEQDIQEAHLHSRGQQIIQWKKDYLDSIQHSSDAILDQTINLYNTMILDELISRDAFPSNDTLDQFKKALPLFKDEIEKLQSILNPIPSVAMQKKLQSIDYALSSNTEFIHYGGGYQYPRHDAALEIGYLSLNSINGINPESDVSNSFKLTTIKGFTLTQKACLSRYANCKLYAQLGGGPLWGRTNTLAVKGKNLNQVNRTIPTTLGVLGGIGFQYPLTSFADLDVAWTHVYVKDYYHFNLCRIALNLHL